MCNLPSFTPKQAFFGRIVEVAMAKQQAVGERFWLTSGRFVSGTSKVRLPADKDVINAQTPEKLDVAAMAVANCPALFRVKSRSPLN